MKLARFEYHGSSEGWWIVRDLPGITIYRTQAGWEISNDPEVFGGFREVADKVWGKDWTPEDLGPGFLTYPTRGEALHELEKYFAPKQDSALAATIS